MPHKQTCIVDACDQDSKQHFQSKNKKTWQLLIMLKHIFPHITTVKWKDKNGEGIFLLGKHEAKLMLYVTFLVVVQLQKLSVNENQRWKRLAKDASDILF
jgi:hypothetical protein